MPEPFDLSVLGPEGSSELVALLQRCPDIEPRRYRDGEYLICENEDDQDLFIVVKGAYTVEHPPLVPTGPPVILASVLCDPERISIVGEMAYFGDFRRTASVRSSGTTYSLCLKPRHIDIIMDGFPTLTRVLCRQFTQRLKEANDALREFQCRFALAASKRMVQAGEVLFTAGEPSPILYQLLVGSLQLERGGQRTVVANEGLFQGFLEPETYLRNRKHTATATAQTDCILVAVDQAHKETLVRCYPELASRIMEA
jgi:CRP-like cAMP-binding protein